MINKVILVGNLTRDPEKRKAGDTPLISFGIAVNEYRKDVEYVNYFDVTVWGNRAKALAGILKKGMKVCVEGSLRYETWTKDDEKRSKVTINANNIEFMSQKQASSDAGEDASW